MAWLYQQKGKSKNWFVGYRHNGKLVCRTTGTADEAEAKRELAKVEQLFGAARAGNLTEELYQALTGSMLPKLTLAAEIEDWLKECRATTAERTVDRYEAFAVEFKTFLNASAKGPQLAAVTTDDIRRYLVEKRSRPSAATTNLARKTLSAIFIRAVKNHHLRLNPVSPIKPFKVMKGEAAAVRRGFTLDELGKVYGQAPSDFWRVMVQGGFYTGLRLGDLICMKWGTVDFSRDRLVLKDEKTGKDLFIPLAKPLRKLLANVKATAAKAKPSDYVWPVEAARYQEKGSGVFSAEFYKKVLTPCGLVTPRSKSHKATGTGHTGKRQTNEVSFHSLRHSFVSFLRSTGNQAVAKELAGHASDQVNSLYTHVPEEALVNAINLLPEFTK